MLTWIQNPPFPGRFHPTLSTIRKSDFNRIVTGIECLSMSNPTLDALRLREGPPYSRRMIWQLSNQHQKSRELRIRWNLSRSWRLCNLRERSSRIPYMTWIRLGCPLLDQRIWIMEEPTTCITERSSISVIWAVPENLCRTSELIENSQKF